MVSLSALILIPDPTVPSTEVWAHPDLIQAIRAAFVRADFSRSLGPTRAVIHPFSTVGDDDGGEAA